MVLRRPFSCATAVYVKADHEATLAKILGSRRWALVTSQGWIYRGLDERLERSIGRPQATLFDVPSNPKISDVLVLASKLPEVDTVVAVGGGSVLDAAKGIVALKALNGQRKPFVQHLLQGVPLPAELTPMPMIAVPTTSGTGSEVTQWGTIWGEDGAKHSLSHKALAPEYAVLDPALCISMPKWITVASGLDAISHAMEAIWNRNHSPITDEFAIAAIRLLRDTLATAVRSPNDTALRGQVQLGALLAGLAMGTTQTALAHSISYPFTSKFNIPHGIACSFTLGEVAAYNIEAAPDRLDVLAQAMECPLIDLVDQIYHWLDTFGVAARIREHVTLDAINSFSDDLITPARAANNIRDIDSAHAKVLAARALDRLGRTDAITVGQSKSVTMAFGKNRAKTNSSRTP